MLVRSHRPSAPALPFAPASTLRQIAQPVQSCPQQFLQQYPQQQ